MRGDSRSRLCLRHHWPLLLQLAALVTAVTSLPVHSLDKRAPVSSNVDSRQQCTAKLGTCQFYTHCIESLFLCESTGFSIAYAEKRCEQIRRLESLGVTEDQVVRWQLDSERCFQERLLDLVTVDFQNITADPPSCLRLERRALEELNSCYEAANPSVCSIIDQASSLESLECDLSVVADAVGIDETYYRSTAEEALLNSVRKCSHPASTALADSLVSRPLPRRVVFCTFVRIFHPDGELVPQRTDYVSILSSNLNRSSEQFIYSTPDTKRICAPNTPQDASSTLQFHLVTWLADANDTAVANLPRNSTTGYNGERSFVFFELRSERRLTLCGNGRREAGELCDYSGGDGNCNISTCMPVSPFECHTHLGPSSCWLREYGDGFRSSNEECDDGNTIAGDGCSSACQIEMQYECSSEYNRTSVCSERQQVQHDSPTLTPSFGTTTHTHITTPTSKFTISGSGRLLHSTPLLLFAMLSALLTVHTLLAIR